MIKDYELTSKDVEERLSQIFEKRLGIKIEDYEDQLFGSNIGLTARDLVYICFDIEKEFEVMVDDYCIENYELTTFSNVMNFIISRLEDLKSL